MRWKVRKTKEWNPWFAWHPVRIGNTWIWLEWVERRVVSLSHAELLRGIRFSPAGNPWFQGETGDYWGKRRAGLRDKDEGGAVADSKAIGWE